VHFTLGVNIFDPTLMADRVVEDLQAMQDAQDTSMLPQILD